ncbi:MAG: RagB/SusD family nutrient uptake outer membrane protein [Chitinophagales bacterium]|nr:RagB/SusD family nutrient uptake outer membrane protein [Chitinophagales bacterium]MDW8393600.1 RagB/SusD family nutrient uptake outer membrane protein [Chitinophagales bacterium]
MKSQLKNIFLSAAWLLAVSALYPSCTIDEQVDLNAPSVDGIEANATVSELNNLVAGILSGQRNDLDIYLDDHGIIGRDFYRFSSADPRFTADIPGAGSAFLDNNTFYITRPWAACYQVIRNAWVLRHAVVNTSAPLTDEQRKGYLGFAKTIQALQMIWLSNLTHNNPDGCIRVDVEDPDNLGPLVTYDEALNYIAALLDEAYGDLNAAGSSFLFPLSTGFSSFNTPATFAQFNRALRARVAAYQQDWNGVLTSLSGSFINPAGSLTTGAYVSFSTASGDRPNSMYISLPNLPTNARVAVNSWVTDAEPGDLRLSKVAMRTEPAVSGPFSSNYDVAIWSSLDDDIAIIRNEELILLSAEAKIQLGDHMGGVADLNIIRSAAGLPAYSGSMDHESLINEMLKQRRYSLFGEGHRWVDMRRYNRLDQIQTDNPDEDVWPYFPIPASEG